MLYLANSWDNNRWGGEEEDWTAWLEGSLDKSCSPVRNLLSAPIIGVWPQDGVSSVLFMFLCLSSLLQVLRNSHSCFSTTSKLCLKVREVWSEICWEWLIIIITGSQFSFDPDLHRQNCIPGQLHSQLGLIRTSQARSYLGLQYSKAFISFNFNISG